MVINGVDVMARGACDLSLVAGGEPGREGLRGIPISVVLAVTPRTGTTSDGQGV